MDRLIDEIVKVSVSDAIAAATPTSVNTAAVLGVSTKPDAATQVLYDQASVAEAYETGVARVLEYAPTVTTAAAGTVTIKIGLETVATASTTDESTVASLVSALAKSFESEDYTAVASATKLTITANKMGTAANSDTFSATSAGTGFSGTVSQTTAGVDSAGIVSVTRSFFLEADNPGRLVCIPVASAPTVANIASVLDGALGMGKDANGREVDFYNVILRIESGNAGDIIEMIEGDATHTGIEDWCKENFRLAHVEFTDRTLAQSVIDGLAAPTTRVAYYFHGESTGKSLAAALVADRCGNDPARGTWAHKTLGSVVADATTKAQLIDAQDKGLNVYVKIAGVERTYMGTTGSKTAFIDEVVKKDWLKFRTQEAIFNLLGQANNGDGVDYNDNGIQAVAAAVTGIFNTAMDNDHRYVLPDSTEVTVPKYADIPAEDKAVRNLPDVKATFSIQASIHTVKTVELQVVA